jgi:hypothetical protein
MLASFPFMTGLATAAFFALAMLAAWRRTA